MQRWQVDQSRGNQHQVIYIGVINPNGGINILWPLFGIANQILAAIALCVANGILVKSGKLKHAWVTGPPLAWLFIITSSAGRELTWNVEFWLSASHALVAKIAGTISWSHFRSRSINPRLAA